MSGFLSDADVVTRVLGHIDKGTTDRGERVWEEPVENYRCAERFERERALMRSVPTPFCPSAAIAEPGAYVAREAAGTPLIVVRGQDGRARAFVNACRHRGAQLVDGEGCAGAFVCPYHGWSYGLDGALRGIPHESGFPDFDRAGNGLREVTAIESKGLIFVVQDDDPDTDAHTMIDVLPELLKDDQILFDRTEGVVEANWKLHLESFLEGYHIKPAHKATFYPFGFDNLNVIERAGPHGRVTFPFRRIEALRGQDAPDVSGKLTYVTHIFPNVILAELTHHRTLGILEPIDVGRTRIINYHMSRSTDAAGRDKALEDARRDVAFVADTGQLEDIALVTSIQRSLQSPANEVFTFGHFEPALVHFHEQMHRRMDAKG